MENKIFIGGVLSILFLLGTVFGVTHSRHSKQIVHNEIQRAPAKSSIKETRTKIAIIDTGIRLNAHTRKYLCKTGHKSFIYGQKPLQDAHGHGTNVASLIIPHMDNKLQCLVIVKFWDTNMGTANGMELVRLSLLHVEKLGVSYINMSLTGTEPDHSEYQYVKRLLKKGVKIAVAAGNENMNLDKTCQSYPACYNFTSKNFRVVGSSTPGLRALQRTVRVKKSPKKEKPRIVKVNGKWYEQYEYSNKGSRITHWANGSNVGKPVMTGTSQATATITGKWIKEGSRGTN